MRRARHNRQGKAVMRDPKYVAAGVFSVLVGASLLMMAFGARRVDASAARAPVLAELFTSEGCSSCPPADDLLRRLIEEQPVDGVEVIAVSEHVDYWNRLGWRDPFSSAHFSERQNAYANAFGTSQIYTPQLVIDGRLQVVGSDLAAVRRSLLEAAGRPRAAVRVVATRSADMRLASVRVAVRDVPAADQAGPIHVVVAIVEDHLTTDVMRGENARRRLKHHAVARVLGTIATLADRAAAGDFEKEIEINREWVFDRLRVVAFLQNDRTRHVVGAASADIQ